MALRKLTGKIKQGLRKAVRPGILHHGHHPPRELVIITGKPEVTLD